MRCWGLAVIGVLAVFPGCGKLGAVATLEISPYPFAVGSFFHVAIFDDSISELNPYYPGAPSMTLSDPSIARVADPSELPPTLALTAGSGGNVVLLGLTPGQTTIEMEADFDDGSHRRAKGTLRVRAIDALDISPTCSGKVDLPLLTTMGSTYAFDVTPRSGGQALAGYSPGSILGDGVSCTPAILPIITDLSTDDAACQWPAPPGGGAVVLTSPLLVGYSQQVSTYGPADVTAVAAAVSSGYRQIGVAGQGGGAFTGHVLVGGKRPCHSLTLQVATLTPAVCAGPAGEATWLSGTTGTDDEQSVAYSSLADGQCSLSLGAAGADSNPTTVQLPVRVASDVTGAHAFDLYHPCTTEGALTCTSTFISLVICKNGYWNVYNDCPQGQICEFFEAGSNGCATSTGCARCL